MIVKIIYGATSVFLECDHIECVQADGSENIQASCWNKGERTNWPFKEAYIMENGKTVEHLIAKTKKDI